MGEWDGGESQDMSREQQVLRLAALAQDDGVVGGNCRSFGLGQDDMGWG